MHTYIIECRRKGDAWLQWSKEPIPCKAALDQLEELRHRSKLGQAGFALYEFRAVCLYADGNRRDVEMGDA